MEHTENKKQESMDNNQIAMKVSAVSIAINLILSVLKLIAGIVAHSGAMVSDAIHSASDVGSTLIVIVGVRLSGKQSDQEHPYGHERMECVSSIILSGLLLATGIGIGISGMETRPDNVLIYATSNRRHLIKETWNDRDDMETDNGMHRSDTVQEKLSLVARFGVTIYYGKPTPKEFFTIVKELRKRYPEITMSDEELCAEANKWELSHGGVSGRTAQQFINYIAGKSAEK